MKKYSTSNGSSRFRNLFLLIVIAIVLTAGTLLVNSYISKPTQLGSRASETSTAIPPITARLTVPEGATLLTNGKGITNNATMTAGNFQVEGFCTRKSLGAVSQTSTDWFCGSYKLQIKDYDEICNMTYSKTNAFVIKTGTSSTQAYNWRCYSFPATSTTTTTTTANGIACGEPCGGQDNNVVLSNICDQGTCGNRPNGTNNRCLPSRAPGYDVKGGNCVDDPNTGVYCLNKSDGTPIRDVAGIQTACAAQAAALTTATPTPGVTPTPAATNTGYNISDLNKNGKADPDDYKRFVEDYLKHL